MPLPPDPEQSRLLLARYTEARQWDRALHLAREMLSHEPDSARLHQVCGQALLTQSKPVDAEKHLRRSLALDPGDDFTLFLLGLGHVERRDPRSAEDCYHKAIAMNPVHPAYWRSLGELILARDDVDSALFCARKARELDPADPAVLNLLASIAGHSGDMEGQWRLLHESLSLDPEKKSTLLRLGEISLQEKRDAVAAEQWFRKALALDPADKHARRNLLKALRRRDPFLRFLYAPWRAAERTLLIFKWAVRKKWPLLFVIPLAKVILAAAVISGAFWLIWMCLPAKLYEYLTLADIRARAGDILARRGGILSVHEWPLALRFSAFAVLTALAVVFVTWAWISGFLALVFPVFASIVLIAFLGLAVYGWGITARSGIDKRRRKKSLRQHRN